MKSRHDYFGEYKAADKRRRRAYRDGADGDELARVDAAYWEKREALRDKRASDSAARIYNLHIQSP